MARTRSTPVDPSAIKPECYCTVCEHPSASAAPFRAHLESENHNRCVRAYQRGLAAGREEAAQSTSSSTMSAPLEDVRVDAHARLLLPQEPGVDLRISEEAIQSIQLELRQALREAEDKACASIAAALRTGSGLPLLGYETEHLDHVSSVSEEGGAEELLLGEPGQPYPEANQTLEASVVTVREGGEEESEEELQRDPLPVYLEAIQDLGALSTIPQECLDGCQVESTAHPDSLDVLLNFERDLAGHEDDQEKVRGEGFSEVQEDIQDLPGGSEAIEEPRSIAGSPARLEELPMGEPEPVDGGEPSTSGSTFSMSAYREALQAAAALPGIHDRDQERLQQNKTGISTSEPRQYKELHENTAMQLMPFREQDVRLLQCMSYEERSTELSYASNNPVTVFTNLFRMIYVLGDPASQNIRLAETGGGLQVYRGITFEFDRVWTDMADDIVIRNLLKVFEHDVLEDDNQFEYSKAGYELSKPDMSEEFRPVFNNLVETIKGELRAANMRGHNSVIIEAEKAPVGGWDFGGEDISHIKSLPGDDDMTCLGNCVKAVWDNPAKPENQNTYFNRADMFFYEASVDDDVVSYLPDNVPLVYKIPDTILPVLQDHMVQLTQTYQKLVDRSVSKKKAQKACDSAHSMLEYLKGCVDENGEMEFETAMAIAQMFPSKIRHLGASR